MFSELEALVAVAERGSMERAAADLYLTPSALSRRIQRLESELGIVLLDRNFKPPRVTQAGLEVLEKSRSILSSVSELKSSGSSIPAGPFRLGLSYALARPEISEVIVELGKQFPLLLPNICNDVSPELMARLKRGELDAVLTILPEGTVVPHELDGVTLARDTTQLVRARFPAARKSSRSPEFYRQSWVLNPTGCLVRQQISDRVERLGCPLVVAAELHNPDLQLSLIAGNVGVGIFQTSFLKAHRLRAQVHVFEDANFDIAIKIVFFCGKHLGTRQQVAAKLQQLLVKHFKK
jgi:DNA-binding transcriptional LysR family regulator